MEVRTIKFPFKAGKREKWIAWCEKIMDRQDEAMKTMENEQVVLEGMFVDDQFAYILMVTQDHDQAIETVENEPTPIDRKHRQQMQECLETDNYEFLDQYVDLQRF